MARRPQVNTDLGPAETTQTVARPVSSPVTRPSVGISKGAQLADALSSLMPQLQGYVKEAEQGYQEDEANRAYDTIQGMTFEEAQAAVKSGEMRDTESPWYQAAFEKQFGLAYAGKRKREIVDKYNNEFDKHGGNIEEFLSGFAAEDMERFGGSKFIMGGVRQGMEGILPKIKDDQAEFQSNWTRERTTENFGQIARTTIDAAVEFGDDPMTAVRTLYKDHKATFGMTYAQMDAMVFGLATEYAASGDVETLEAILNHEAIGADGTKVGSFMSRPKYSLDAQKLLDTAQANRGEQNRAANTTTVVDLRVRSANGTLTDDDRVQLQTMRDDEQLSQAQHESILQQNTQGQARAVSDAYVRNQTAALQMGVDDILTNGKAYTLQDVSFTDIHTGTVHSFTAEELIETSTRDALNAMAANEATPQQMAAQLASWGVDETYSVWENALNNGIHALSEPLATEGKDGKMTLPEPAIAGYSTWKSLADQPQLRERHISSGAAGSVYRDAEALEKLGVDPEEALLRSASIDRKDGAARVNSLSRKQIEDMAASPKVPWTWGRDVANKGQAAMWIEDMVNVQVALGVGPKQAVENGIKAYEEAHTVINGVAIDTRSSFVPPNFEEASGVMLQSFAEQHGEDVGDLTMVPAFDGSSTWIVAYKGNTAIPVTLAGRGNRFHVNQIMQASEDLKPNTLDEVNTTIIENSAKARTRAGRTERVINAPAP